MPRPHLLVLFVLLPAFPAAAQLVDDFSDGDFTAHPPWTGTAERWTIAPLDGNPALRSNGVTASDTLSLATPSTVSRGTWAFTLAYRSVNLSNFNGARVFLMADAAALAGSVSGYFLQLGASNSDEVRLYRQDGDPATGRVLLAQSAEPLLDGEEATLAVVVTRSEAYAWEVTINATPVLTAVDSTYTASRFFGLWLKHTQAAPTHFFFDDVSVQGKAGPGDTSAPSLIGAEALDAERVAVTFDEPVDACAPEHYAVSNGIGTPATLEPCAPEGQASYVLRLARPLVNGAGYILTVRDIMDRAGNVLAAASTTFTYVDAQGPPPGPGDVVVNEIYYDPPDASLEFVELYNRSGRTFDLRRFGLSDDRRQPSPVSDMPRALLPGGYAVLVRDGAAFSTAFPGVDFVEVPAWPALNNDGDAAVLFVEDTVIDAVTYEPGWGRHGVSLERKDPDGPSNSRFNFGASTAAAGATPGFRNSRYAPDVAPPHPFFAEQVTENLVDIYLDEPADPASVHPAAFTLDDGRTPERVFIDDETTRLRLHFAAPPSGSRLTVAGLQDLTGNTLTRTSLDLAYLARPGDLLIHEIMYDPRADPFDALPDQPEYVELYNKSTRTLTLRGQYWTDMPDETGHADTVRFGDDFFFLRPDGFAVLFAEPNPTSNPATESTLLRAFPDLAASADSVTLLPLARSTLGLVNGGALLYLHRADDTGLDSAFYDPAWHHASLIDTRGVALERITTEGSGGDPSHWTSSVAPAGGTPGRPNSVRLQAGVPVPKGHLDITPSPFSPDRDGLDDVTAIRYTLEQAAALIRVRIFDAQGRLVRSLEEAHLTAQEGALLWDGLDDAGHALRIGIYVVLFEAIAPRHGTTLALKAPVVLARPLD